MSRKSAGGPKPALPGGEWVVNRGKTPGSVNPGRYRPWNRGLRFSANARMPSFWSSVSNSSS